MTQLPSALVVEDDDTIREALSLTLQSEGFDTREAATLSEARAALDVEQPTVVVLDLMLPDGRGDELLSELARASHSPPTVLVSASPDAPDIAMRYGIAWMRKPFDLDRLIGALKQAIARGRSPSVPPTSA